MLRVLALLLCLSAPAGHAQPHPEVPAAPELSLPEVASRIAERYRGRLLSIRLDRPLPHERRLGAETMFVADYLTPADNRLEIRMDGDTGAFLTVEGVGQVAARIRP